jgi:hypothetical protein
MKRLRSDLKIQEIPRFTGGDVFAWEEDMAVHPIG